MPGRAKSGRDDFEFSTQPRNVRPRNSNRPSEYRSFEGTTKTIRAGAIRSLAEQVIQNSDEGRRKNMADDAAAGHKLSSEVLQARYKEAPRFTAGTVFGCGNGVLNTFARDEVIRRREAREEKLAAAEGKRRKNLIDLRDQVRQVRKEIKEKGKKFKWTCITLKPIVRWKMLSPFYKKPTDKTSDAVPTRKPKLLEKYNKVKDLPSPQISPCNSEAEDESEGENPESEEEEAQEGMGLEFDSGESDSDESGSDGEALSDDEGE